MQNCNKKINLPIQPVMIIVLNSCARQFYIRYLDAQSKPLALTIDVFSIVVMVYNQKPNLTHGLQQDAKAGRVVP